MKKFILFFLFFLISAQAVSKPTINIKKILKENDGNILAPEDVKNGIPQIQSGDFPITWKQISYGQYKNKIIYNYSFMKSEGNRTFYKLELNGSPVEVSEYFIERGLEYTISAGSLAMDAGMKNGCIFVLGKCEYPYIKESKVLKTSFKNGVWTSTYPNGSGSGVLTTIYDKHGLIIYRHSIVKNSIEHFESEIFREK